MLLISIDGFHALDYLNCSKGIPGFNGGNPYCPNLAELGTMGVNYLDTSTSKPSDSFPGLMALMTGGSPRTMGVNYDVAYDRALNPPMDKTGNGLIGGPCTSGATPTGTSTEYDEGIKSTSAGIDANQMFLNGGAPSGDGGINSIESDPPGTRRELRSGLSVELCPRQHDFRSHPRRGRLHGLVRQASVVFVGGRPHRYLHRH